ncbi:hypothetical protein P7C70_g1448, partial [Phenoliferia sp. Uapishka_3]
MHFSTAQSAILVALSFFSTTFAAPVPQGLVHYVPCPNDSPRFEGLCSAVINGDGIHTADEFTQHLGTQSDILGKTAAKVVNDEGVPGVDGASLATAGEDVDALTINGVELVKKDSYPTTILESEALIATGAEISATTKQVGGLVKDVGVFVPTQSKEFADAGTGVQQVGTEAKAQFNRLGNGVIAHGPSTYSAFQDALAPIPIS